MKKQTISNSIFCNSSKNIYAGGLELAEEARQIAGKGEFKGNNGWLDKWKKRYS